MPQKSQPAIGALMLAVESRPGWRASERIAFLHARPHDALRDLRERLSCEQSWKPVADELLAAGFAIVDGLLEEWGEFDLVLLLPGRQREQTLFDLAHGMKLLRPNGVLIASLPNNWGASRYEKHLADLAGKIETVSKFHCRAFWARRTGEVDRGLLEEWFEFGTLRPVAGERRFISCPGLFSWDRIDRGSQLLVDHLPADISGRAADLGAGWGFLADFLLRERPSIKTLDLYEADARALDAARANLASISTATSVGFHWHDVAKGLGDESYDCIVLNPPFHAGRAADPLVGHRFTAAAVNALRPDGQLWMVANQNLPYERFLAQELPGARLVIQKNGFKILTGRKAAECSERKHPERARL
jgi:16S rRNA (guanine1207-N2)-methyltransferase